MSTAAPSGSPDLVVGADGLARCPWGVTTSDYQAYHDEEWGRPVRGESALYERLTLEAFQSGLSWLTVLRKREAFREVFAGFDADVVAGYDEDDVLRLLADARIIRNRSKVEAAVANARAVVALREAGGLDALVWSHRPDPRPAPHRLADVPASTEESVTLARALKRAGVRFVGPTTAYATMQACGLVDDHLAGCCARREPEAATPGGFLGPDVGGREGDIPSPDDRSPRVAGY